MKARRTVGVQVCAVTIENGGVNHQQLQLTIEKAALKHPKMWISNDLTDSNFIEDKQEVMDTLREEISWDI